MKKNITEEDIKLAVENSTSAIEASKLLNVQYKTFRRYAKLYKLWKPNQSGKGTIRGFKSRISTSDIISGKVFYSSTYNLKLRLLREGVLENKCSVCGISTWNGSQLSLELHHIDGNHYNHRLENLKLLCPNCHSQTTTFRSKKRI